VCRLAALHLAEPRTQPLGLIGAQPGDFHMDHAAYSSDVAGGVAAEVEAVRSGNWVVGAAVMTSRPRDGLNRRAAGHV
jgi:hypothetical protein